MLRFYIKLRREREKKLASCYRSINVDVILMMMMNERSKRTTLYIEKKTLSKLFQENLTNASCGRSISKGPPIFKKRIKYRTLKY